MMLWGSGTAAKVLRSRLGEWPASMQKLDVPVVATTPSPEALKACSMAVMTSRITCDPEAILLMEPPQIAIS